MEALLRGPFRALSLSLQSNGSVLLAQLQRPHVLNAVGIELAEEVVSLARSIQALGVGKRPVAT